MCHNQVAHVFYLLPLPDLFTTGPSFSSLLLDLGWQCHLCLFLSDCLSVCLCNSVQWDPVMPCQRALTRASGLACPSALAQWRCVRSVSFRFCPARATANKAALCVRAGLPEATAAVLCPLCANGSTSSPRRTRSWSLILKYQFREDFVSVSDALTDFNLVFNLVL